MGIMSNHVLIYVHVVLHGENLSIQNSQLLSIFPLRSDDSLYRKDALDSATSSCPLFSPQTMVRSSHLHYHEHHEAVDCPVCLLAPDIDVVALLCRYHEPVPRDAQTSHGFLELENVRFVLMLLPDASNLEYSSQTSHRAQSLLSYALFELHP